MRKCANTQRNWIESETGHLNPPSYVKPSISLCVFVNRLIAVDNNNSAEMCAEGNENANAHHWENWPESLCEAVAGADDIVMLMMCEHSVQDKSEIRK